MNIYTDMDKYNNALKYFCNACGELFIDGKDCKIEDLPLPLQDVYNRLWQEGSGSYAYIASYNGEYGILLINEYHELTDEGKAGNANNFEKAVKVAEEFEKAFPKYTVFIGKQMGFPGYTDNAIEMDKATELCVFSKPEDMTTEDFKTVTDWLYENAYK